MIDRFVEEYLAGRTPNPCVACNNEVKFAWLLAACPRARSEARHRPLRARRAARRAPRAAARRRTRRTRATSCTGSARRRCRDVLFPVGELPKPEVRRIAERYGLPVAHKPDSQEICFVTRGDAADFVALRAPRG